MKYFMLKAGIKGSFSSHLCTCWVFKITYLYFICQQEFMLCREELSDPRKCIKEGKEVTNCGIEFFKKVKKSCLAEFTQYQRCLIAGSSNFEYAP